MNVIRPQKKHAVLSALLEGCSLRSASRMTGAHLETVLRVLVEAGAKCQAILDERLRGLVCESVECDELWTFIQKKQRRLTDEDRLLRPEYGDTYAFVALDPSSKAVLNFAVGKRDSLTALQFMADLSERLTNRPQISTDGFLPYREAVESAFGSEVDYAQLIKMYAAEHPGPGRYSPPHVTGLEIHNISGRPKASKVCTSYVERNNLTMRLHMMRRFTRLTNAFSRKLENLKASLSLWFWYYNVCRIHGSLRATPAMALVPYGRNLVQFCNDFSGHDRFILY